VTLEMQLVLLLKLRMRETLPLRPSKLLLHDVWITLEILK
jgi:hypothetical protein